MAYSNVSSKSFSDTVNGVKTDKELEIEQIKTRIAEIKSHPTMTSVNAGQQLFTYFLSLLSASWIVMFAVAIVGFPLGYGTCLLVTWAVVSVISLGVYSGGSAVRNQL